MKRWVRDLYKESGYVYATRAWEIAKGAGCPKIARLASNENPSPPSPAVVAAACEAVKGANRYPPENQWDLLAALKRWHPDEHMVLGAGMDGVIETVIRVLVGAGDPVVISTPTFSFYGIAAAAQGARVVLCRREPDFSVNVPAFLQAFRGARLAFLCTPNNPTGNVTPPETVAEILDGIEGVLFLDNAYVEFSGTDYRPLLREYDNLVIGRTLSKIHALAGLRLGYALVPAWMDHYLEKAKTPFAVSVVAAAAGAAALGEAERAKAYAAHVARWRERYTKEIRWKVHPSGANFVLVDVAPLTGTEAMERLAARCVLVRSCASFPDLADHYLRVSIGEDWENELLIREINAL
ncbi:MAG: hisC1 [Methanomicrobiales archaeon]|nr:hisC1 [Methanomicrobiales archaeon]